MFFNSLKLLLKVKLTNSSDRTSNVYRTIWRGFSSKCKTKSILLDPSCKSAVVTGGTGAIGYATAHELLKLKARKVALVGTDVKKGMESINNLNCSFGKSKAVFFKCDVRCKDEVTDTMKKVEGELDEIDIVINTAGVWDDIDWSTELLTNLAGTINVNLVAKDYIQKGNGVIVNLTGLQGLYPFPPSPTFASFASGIIHFSRSFGHDDNFKRDGIRVVVLCIGITQSDLHLNVEKKMLTNEMGQDLEEFLKQACRQKPDACAKAVVELLKFGPSSSVWIVEGSRLFYVDLPNYNKHLKLVSQFV